MKRAILLALTGGCLSAHAAVQLSFSKHKHDARETLGGAARRSDSVSAGLSYQGATYVVNVTVGTPGQPVSLQISTSASNTFVVDARSTQCTEQAYYDDYDEDLYGDTDTSVSTNLCPWGTCKSVLGQPCLTSIMATLCCRRDPATN